MMTSKKSSFSFSYNLSKPYPYTWFTPVVVVGGIVGLALFSMINLASNGYELSTIYINDPNTTISERPWYLRWSWDQQLQPQCESRDISIGSQVFTSNLGFTYTLTGVSRQHPERVEKLGSLSYLNQTLKKCHVKSIQLDLKKLDLSRNGKGYFSSWSGSSADTVVQCTIIDSDGLLVEVLLTTHYMATPADYSYAISSDPITHASMWWGTRLLNAYWHSMLLALSQQLYGKPGSNFTVTPTWMSGGMTFTPNPHENNIQKYEFFNHPKFTFVAYDGDIENDLKTNITDLNLIYNNIGYLPYSGTLTQGLSWAKIMHSAVLVDIGQTPSTTSSPSQNLLTEPTLLQYILKHPDDTLRNDQTTEFNATRICFPDTPAQLPCYEHFQNINMFAPPNAITADPEDPDDKKNTSMIDAYDAFHDMMGPLGTKTTTIFSQYACQVPKRKSFGTVMITVLVADMVFLQACWVLLRLVTDWFVGRNDGEAMWCEGCSKKSGGGMDGV